MAPGAPNGERAPKVYSVAELTRRIKAVLEGEVGSVWVEGELSNLRQPASGHYYFTLKDETAQISAVLFRGNQRGLKFKPHDGVRVRALGDVTVYERGGNYQIIVRQLEESGKGALQARFEALKAQLQKEGLFDAARKKPIPLLPRHVGVVTSPTGAAIRDILNVILRRFPNLHVLIAPVRVQGEGAAAEIAAAIDFLNARGGLDVLIVGRGGGSLEDLWCFNEEPVARAIARSAIPVISAVGHEIDFTISDFVADLRAPTPSAAAELVVGRKDAFEERLAQLRGRLAGRLRQAVLEARNRVLSLSRRCLQREPRGLIRRYQQRAEGLAYRLAHAMSGRVRDGQQRLDEAGVILKHRVEVRMQFWRQRLQQRGLQLDALNPLAVLQRGYSVTRDEAGRILRSSGQVQVGSRIRTALAEGEVDSEVRAVRAPREDGGRSG